MIYIFISSQYKNKFALLGVDFVKQNTTQDRSRSKIHKINNQFN